MKQYLDPEGSEDEPRPTDTGARLIRPSINLPNKALSGVNSVSAVRKQTHVL